MAAEQAPCGTQRFQRARYKILCGIALEARSIVYSSIPIIRQRAEVASTVGMPNGVHGVITPLCVHRDTSGIVRARVNRLAVLQAVLAHVRLRAGLIALFSFGIFLFIDRASAVDQ